MKLLVKLIKFIDKMLTWERYELRYILATELSPAGDVDIQ